MSPPRQKQHERAPAVLRAVDRAAGLVCDQTIALGGAFMRPKPIPDYLRRIRFKDPDTDKTLVFLANNLQLPPETICALYKSRWQVALFF